MFPYKMNHRLFLLCGILLATACNNNQKNLDKLIESDNREALSQYRIEIQKELQQLNEKAQIIDAYLEEKRETQHMAYITIDTLKHTMIKHYIEVKVE